MKHPPPPPPPLSPLGVAGMDAAGMDVATDVKVAPTDLAAVIATMQVPVPEHAPDQPEKVFPLLAEAVRVTDVPELKLAEHVEPQLIMPSLLVTVPAPVSDVETIKLYTVVE
jgi:hypothetical protein